MSRSWRLIEIKTWPSSDAWKSWNWPENNLKINFNIVIRTCTLNKRMIPKAKTIERTYRVSKSKVEKTHDIYDITYYMAHNVSAQPHIEEKYWAMRHSECHMSSVIPLKIFNSAAKILKLDGVQNFMTIPNLAFVWSLEVSLSMGKIRSLNGSCMRGLIWALGYLSETFLNKSIIGDWTR